MASTSEDADRRQAVRDLVVAGGIGGPRQLAERLAAEGVDVEPAELKADLRALGIVRVVGPDGPELAVPVDREAAAAAASGPAPDGGLKAVVVDDPDWKLQAAVVSVVALLVLVGLLGFLLGP